MYDYIIIGSGVSGAVCAHELSKRGHSCLIIEKHYKYYEKVCGGGVSYKALHLLNNIGIDINELRRLDSKSINGHIVYKKGKTLIKEYKKENVSIGIQRNVFDQFLIQQAVAVGTEVIYGEPVVTIDKFGDRYRINDYEAKNVIIASGARPLLKGKISKQQSIGYSAQITADVLLDDHKFYYWYYSTNNDSKYFWAFPIGENLWNIGVWSRYWYNALKEDFNRCFRDIFQSHILDEFQYYRMPKAEFLGHMDQRNFSELYSNGIGDFAGRCNPLNGGGIIGAIESAISLAENEKEKR